VLSPNRPKIFRRSLKINFFKIGLNACVSARCGRRRVFRSMEIFRLRRWKAVVRQFGRGRARRFGGDYAGAAAPGMIVPEAVVPGRALGRGGISGAIFRTGFPGPDTRGCAVPERDFRVGYSRPGIRGAGCFAAESPGGSFPLPAERNGPAGGSEMKKPGDTTVARLINRSVHRRYFITTCV